MCVLWGGKAVPPPPQSRHFSGLGVGAHPPRLKRSVCVGVDGVKQAPDGRGSHHRVHVVTWVDVEGVTRLGEVDWNDVQGVLLMNGGTQGEGLLHDCVKVYTERFMAQEVHKADLASPKGRVASGQADSGWESQSEAESTRYGGGVQSGFQA